MTEMEVGCAWIEAAVDTQRAVLLFSFEQTLAEFIRHGLLEIFVAVFGTLH
jgi:hypothetical protein